jgi:hypothetical protein
LKKDVDSALKHGDDGSLGQDCFLIPKAINGLSDQAAFHVGIYIRVGQKSAAITTSVRNKIKVAGR